MKPDHSKIFSHVGENTDAGSSSIHPTMQDWSSSNPLLDSTENLINEDIPSAATDDPQRYICSHSNRPLIGIIFAVSSSLIFSFNSILGKLVTHLNSFNVGLWTFLLMTVFAIILMLFHHLRSLNEKSIFLVFRASDNENNIFRKVYFFLLLRSICGVSALLFFFYSVKYIAVGDVSVIDASSPIFVYIMAFTFLGEKFGYLIILTTILAFSGVTLITRPPLFTDENSNMNIIGTILAFSSMLCITMSVITLKFLERVHYSIVIFAFSLWGVLQCAVVTWIMGAFSVPTELWDVLKIVSMAVVFYLGQVFLTQALKYLNAGPVGLLRTTEVVFIFIWQWVFLDVVPDIYTWCGGALIFLGALLTIFRNWINTLDESHGMRNKCGCLLW